MDYKERQNRFFQTPSSLRLRVFLGVFLLVSITASAYLYVKISNLDYSTDTKDKLLTDYTKEQALVAEEEEEGDDSTSTSSSRRSSSSESSTGDSTSQSSSSSEDSGESEGSTPDTPTFVAFYADNQSDSDEDDARHQSVVDKIMATSANPVFHAGDLMEDGTSDSWNRFINIATPILSSKTFYAALGNNDRVVGDPTAPSPYYLDFFNFPGNEQWYSVDYGNLHMVVLDSAFSSGSATQLDWLASDLQSAESQNKVTGVMYHHPSFISTVNSYLTDYGADFVINGHIHTYSKSELGGVTYFSLPGGTSIGYALANIYSNSISITFYNNAGGTIATSSFSAR